jgi:hypothetical protein
VAVTGRALRRLVRLAEELEESGLQVPTSGSTRELLLEEVDKALRPQVHERRVASSGTILDPVSERDRWSQATQLDINCVPIDGRSVDSSRSFADGLSSWLLRRAAGDDEWLLFDRPAGSERDLVVIAAALQATIVQRHPSGTVRIVGDFGVLRWQGLSWHHEPPVGAWIDLVLDGGVGEPTVLRALLEFAVHDLGSLAIGALLIYRGDRRMGPPVEELLPAPPQLQIRTAFHLAPLRHALAQVDGAAVFDHEGVLRQLGVRIVPSTTAEQRVEPLGGTRHTSGRRYSYDDPTATVIAVSDDGPVSVLRNGTVLGRSASV